MAKFTRDDLKGSEFICETSVLTKVDYDMVYEPNEDTYLLLDALNLESHNSFGL